MCGEDDRPGEHFDWPRATLEQLEGVTWGEPEHRSGLVVRCHRLQTTPLREFTLDDLRCLIGQRISLPILMPLALQVLEADRFAAGMGGPGSLLTTALRADRQFWLSALFHEPVRVDRKSNVDAEPIRIPHPFLSVVGNLTSDMVGELCEARGRSDGREPAQR